MYIFCATYPLGLLACMSSTLMAEIAAIIGAGLWSVVTAVLVLAGLIVLTRLNGLRSFSKMTSFDFVTTLAIGSLSANAISTTSLKSVVTALCGIATLLLLQRLIATGRRGDGSLADHVDNAPVLLMRDGVVDDAALQRHRVTRSDLFGKLREANVLQLDEVRAVVLETTGDISVLHGEHLDEVLLDGVSAD